jgi:iron(III) transport system substrate-binding protein
MMLLKLAATLAIGLATAAPLSSAFAQTSTIIPEKVSITPQLVAAAEKEGQLNLQFNNLLGQMQAIIKQFNQKYPNIRINAERKPSAAGAFALMQEFDSGVNRIDVFQGTDLAANHDLARKRVFAALTPPNANQFNESNAFEAPYLYNSEVITAVVAYNPSYISDADAKELVKWNGTLNPRFKDKISLVEPTLGITQGVLAYVMNTPTLGTKFLRKLKGQNPIVYPSSAPAREALFSGQRPILWGAQWDSVATTDVLKGAPLHFVYNDPAVVITGAAWGVLAKAPHPNAARLFWAWMIGPQGAAANQSADVNIQSSLLDQPDERAALKKVAQNSWFVAPTSTWQTKFSDSIKNGPAYRAEWEKIFKR